MTVVNDVCTVIGWSWSAIFLTTMAVVLVAALVGRVMDYRARRAVSPLRDDLTAIIAAVQDGRVDASPDVCEAVHLRLYELELEDTA